MLANSKMVRQKALERLYDGVCTVIDQVETIDEDGISHFEDGIVVENVPCRVSIGTSPIATVTDVSNVSQAITLFCAPDVTIKKGSQIDVTQYGVTAHYKCAGVPAVYDVFQSVEMELKDEC